MTRGSLGAIGKRKAQTGTYDGYGGKRRLSGSPAGERSESGARYATSLEVPSKELGLHVRDEWCAQQEENQVAKQAIGMVGVMLTNVEAGLSKLCLGSSQRAPTPRARGLG
jgi:hypothetical protein